MDQLITPPYVHHPCEKQKPEYPFDLSGKISSSKSRLEFIDLAKGICITLVVCFHGGAITWPLLLMLRMPLYFMLSGLFYKDYGGIINLVAKKIDKLIIPFLFFLTVTVLSGMILNRIFPAYTSVKFNDITLFKPIPSPVYFLLCLFWDNIIFFVVRRLSKGIVQELTMISIITAIGAFFTIKDIFLPLHLTSALMSIPFFYAGVQTRKISTLQNNSKNHIRDILIFVISLLTVWGFGSYFSWPDIDMYKCHATLNDILIYIPLSIVMVYGFLHLCKVIKHIPILSYLGRYSIITLGIHNIILGLIINSMKSITGIDSSWPGIIVTIFLCILAIPIFRNIFPTMTAQKEILTPILIKMKSSKSCV